MTEREQRRLLDAAGKLLDALAVEECWNIWENHPDDGSECIVSFPDDFNADSIPEALYEARYQLQSAVMDVTFRERYPDLAAKWDRDFPEKSR